jgi:hypothetical protein
MLTELQFTILDGMADDCEDVEQLYFYANPDLPQVRWPLRDVVDEVVNMLRDAYIAPEHSNDQAIAPLEHVNFSALHHYWFEATPKGTEARESFTPP